MAIEQPDFSKIFADGATIGELLNMPDEEYLRGWGYLGQNEPPPMEYFNYIYNLQDNKLKYLFISANIRKSNTQYHVDDIVTSPNLQSKFMLVCVQEGTTDSNEPVLDAAEEGQEITDGTTKWRVFSKLASGITIGEEEPVNARDNAVWFALNGIDEIAKLKYQKDGEWKQIFIQSILNGIKDSPIKSLLRNTSYEVNDILADSTCKGAFFICTFAGTTGASVASGFATAEEGQEITDGTAKFKVHYFKEIISSVNIMSGATSSKGGTAGLVPAPAAGTQTSFLRGDGTWQTIANMTGASVSAAGKAGLVPAPAAGTQNKALFGDGQYKDVITLDYEQTISAKKTFRALYLQNTDTQNEGGELKFIYSKNINKTAGLDLFHLDSQNPALRIIDYSIMTESTRVPFYFWLDGSITTLQGKVDIVKTSSLGENFKYIRYASGKQEVWCIGQATTTNPIITLPVSFSSATVLCNDVGVDKASYSAKWLDSNRVQLFVPSGYGYNLFVVGTEE